MRLDWYVTDMPFLPFPSVINSLDQRSDPWEPFLLGEQYDQPRDYNGRGPVPGLVGGHFCGTRSDFESGQPWPYTGPPVEYDEEGIPYCCPRNRPVAPVAGAQVDTGAEHGYPRAATAGASVDYLVPVVQSARVTAGASADLGPVTPAPTAGASVDYLVPVVQSAAVTAGSGVDILLPHTTCETAEDTTEGTTNTTVMNFVNEQHWYFLTITPDADYWFDWERFSSDGSVNVYGGGCDALLTLIEGFDFNATGHRLFTAPTDGRIWVQFTSFGSPTYVWSIYAV